MAQETKQQEKLPVLADDVIEKRLKTSCRAGGTRASGSAASTTPTATTTLALVNTIGYLAEAAWHHPDLEVTWGRSGSSSAITPRTASPSGTSSWPGRSSRRSSGSRVGLAAGRDAEQVGARRKPGQACLR